MILYIAIVLLIVPKTFSSAMTCALAAKDYGLATVVGEETGEPKNSTGEIFEVADPHTGISGYFTTKFFTDPRFPQGNRGVVPDIVIRTSIDDVHMERDPVLAYALRDAHTRWLR